MQNSRRDGASGREVSLHFTPRRYELLVDNLLENAVRFSPAGATIGLPLLSAMVPAGVARALEAATPRRLAFIYIPHGAILSTSPIPVQGLSRPVTRSEAEDRWTPNGVGRDFELVGDLVREGREGLLHGAVVDAEVPQRATEGVVTGRL